MKHCWLLVVKAGIRASVCVFIVPAPAPIHGYQKRPMKLPLAKHGKTPMKIKSIPRQPGVPRLAQDETMMSNTICMCWSHLMQHGCVEHLRQKISHNFFVLMGNKASLIYQSKPFNHAGFVACRGQIYRARVSPHRAHDDIWVHDDTCGDTRAR